MQQYRLDILGGVDLDTGAHGGGDGAGTDILALGSGGLGLDDSLDQGVHVLLQLLNAEGNLTDGAVDDVGLVQTILDLTGLNLLDGSADIGGHGTGLGGGHQTLGAQDLTQTADDTHHVGGSDDHVELEPVLLSGLLDQIHAVYYERGGYHGANLIDKFELCCKYILRVRLLDCGGKLLLGPISKYIEPLPKNVYL